MSKRNKTVRAKESKELSVSEISNVLIQVPEIAEAFTRADLELALDDRGWLTTGSLTQKEMDPQSRRLLVQKSRLYWQRDPMAKQAVRLWTDYALGDGITVNCNKPDVMKKINAFLKDRRNRPILTSEGQRKSSKKLLIDGDLFFAVFGAENESRTIRRIDPQQITDLICDPDDDERILAYRRILADGKTSLFYADWKENDSESRQLAEQQKIPGSAETVKLQENVVVYLVPFDSIQHRGNGLLFCALDWTREHRRFMEARVALTQALSKYAHKISVKGGQAVVDQVQKKLQSTYQAEGATTLERNPATAPGGSWIQNAGLDIQPMPRATGAGDAKEDADSLKLQVCAATGIMLHYFGDPSTGNLATATAMELPMLKMFASYQKLWTDVYRDLFSIVLDESPDDEPEVIDIDLPPILAEDVQKLGQALAAFTGVFPEMKVDEVLQSVLVALGINNIDDVMKSIEAKREENAAADQQRQQLMTKLVSTGNQPKPGQTQGDGSNPVANNLSTEAANNLANALLKVAEAVGA